MPQSGFQVDYAANPKSEESFEFYLNAFEDEENLEFHCHYDINLFEDITIREWLSTLDSILKDVAADPSRDVLTLARLDREASPAQEIVYCHIFNREVAKQRSANSNSFAIDSPMPPSGRQAPKESEADLQRALIALWQRVLDLRDVGPDDEFFALGGHSIGAAQLFGLIEHELGYSVPLAVLYEASTPRQLAKRLFRGTGAEVWNALVPINRHGDRTPLFLIHAAEGNVLLYRSLASHLGDDQPVYGIQSAGLDGHSPVDPKFEHVASNYIDAIRKIQPHGPYMLGGYCLGGTIALEMAQQLHDAGESVGLVAMIEDYNVLAMRWPLADRHLLINRLFLNPYFHLQNMFAAEGTAKFDFFLEKLRVEVRRVKVSLRGAWAGVRHRMQPGEASPAPRAKLADMYENALTNYDVQPYSGELTLFLAERHLAGFDVPLGGWQGVAARGVRVYQLPFSPRGSLIEPYVKQLAAILRKCLDRAIDPPKAASNEHATPVSSRDVPAESVQLEIHT